MGKGQNCDAPLVFTSQRVEDTMAVVRWFQIPPSPDSFALDIRLQGFPPIKDSSIILAGNKDQYLFDQLLPNTAYSAYIQSLCGPDTSDWKRLDFRTAILSDFNCNLNIPIRDLSCPTGGQQFDYYIRSFSGDSLNRNSKLESVEFIIDHSYPADLNIQLIAPDGTHMSLVEHEGTLNDHFGNPNDSSCQQFTQLSGSACARLSESAPPFIGSYQAVESFDILNERTIPVKGKWSLWICDRAGDDIGSLEYLNLNFSSDTCPEPPPIHQREFADTTVLVGWDSNSSYDSIALLWGNLLNEPDSITDPNFQRIILGPGRHNYRLTNLELSSTYGITSYILCDGRWIGPACIENFTSSCAPISLESNWENESSCNDCNECPLSDPLWSNVGQTVWQISTPDQNPPITDIFGMGTYLYRASSQIDCRTEEAILESICLQALPTADSSCFLSLYTYAQSANSGNVLLLISADEFVTQDTLAIFEPNETSTWIESFVSLPEYYASGIFKLRILAEGSSNSFGNVALADIVLHHIQGVPTFEQVRYVDQDQDGFGSPDSIVLYCGQKNPVFLTLDNQDCNDLNPNIHPNALDTACNGIDENCNGLDNLNGAMPLTITLDTLIPPSCPEFSNGKIAVTVSGGSAPYELLWSTGQDSSVIDSLAKGIYHVSVIDADSCQSILQTFTLQDPNELKISVNIQKNADCPEDGLGIFVASASGGLPPYQYLWSNGDTTHTADSISAGVYALTVTDQEGCFLIHPNIVMTAKSLSGNVIVNRPLSCHNSSNASLRVIMENGLPPFQYHWNTGDTTSSIENVAAGLYSVSIEDAVGCRTVIDSISINAPAPISILNVAVQDISCFGADDGSIEVTAQGGTPPYNYRFTTPDNQVLIGSTIKDLEPGYYRLTINDQKGCSFITDSILVSETNPISIQSLEVQPTTCPLSSDGGIQISISGGQPDYIFSWSDNGPSMSTRNHLPSGKYGLTITDGLGCKEIFSPFQVQAGDKSLFPHVSIIDPLWCLQGDSAFISVQTDSAMAPITYNWSFGSQYTTSGIKDTIGIPLAGSYQVTLTDAIGCVGVSDEVLIDSVAPILILDTLLSDSICPEANNGWIQLNALSNRPPLIYNWGTQEGNRIENLSAGNYSLSLSDASGCPFPPLEFTIAEFAEPEIEIDTFIQGEQICFGVGSKAALDSFSWLVQSNKITDTVICISPVHQSSVILEVYFGNQCISAYPVFGTSSHQYDRSNFINIFPNPTSQYIRVDTDNIPIQYIEIWDALGRISMIIEDPGTQPLINLKGLANGSYWIRFFDQNGWIGTKKIVKQ